MNITECVPLTGRAYSARRGPPRRADRAAADAARDLLADLGSPLSSTRYCEGGAPAPAGTGGAAGGATGANRVGLRRGEDPGGGRGPAHGEAVGALLPLTGSPEAQAYGQRLDPTPVAEKFTWSGRHGWLVIGPPAPPDPRLLGRRREPPSAGGIVLTIKQEEPSINLTKPSV